MAQPTVSLHVSELESRLGTPLVVRGSRRVSPTAAGTLDIGLVALPQPPVRDLVVTHWRNDPMMAFVPPRWQAPKAATPKWLAAQPLIFNDATTRMYRMTMEWFAAAGHAPRARIELNYTEAIKSLVAAGYGAAILPMESSAVAVAAGTDPLQLIPLRPALTRSLGVAHRVPSSLDGATRIVLATLERFRQR